MHNRIFQLAGECVILFCFFKFAWGKQPDQQQQPLWF